MKKQPGSFDENGNFRVNLGEALLYDAKKPKVRIKKQRMCDPLRPGYIEYYSGKKEDGKEQSFPSSARYVSPKNIELL